MPVHSHACMHACMPVYLNVWMCDQDLQIYAYQSSNMVCMCIILQVNMLNTEWDFPWMLVSVDQAYNAKTGFGALEHTGSPV